MPSDAVEVAESHEPGFYGKLPSRGDFVSRRLPQRFITRFLPKNRTLAISMGAGLGLIFPMCECGIVPVMRRLLRKGLPLSCCTAYMLAGPIINPIVLLSTYFAFAGMENTLEDGKFSYQMGGWWMLGLRAGLGFLVAVGTSLLVERLWKEPWKVWFPRGKSDPSIAILRFDADHGELWDAAGLRGVRYAFEAAKAYVRGETPRTDETHGRARL